MATKAQNARQPYGLTDELVDSLLNGSTTHEEVFGENGIYRQLTKRLFERMLETEMTHHLGYEKYQKPEHEQRILDGGNARNGSSGKTLKTMHSEVELSIPRDRQGQFEPRIIPKGSTRLPEIERTILALYGGGMSTRDIAAELHRAYGIDASPTFISDVTGVAFLKMSSSGGIVPCNRSIRWHFSMVFALTSAIMGKSSVNASMSHWQWILPDTSNAWARGLQAPKARHSGFRSLPIFAIGGWRIFLLPRPMV